MENEQEQNGNIFKLSMAANTLIPCYLALRWLGFTVTKKLINGEESWSAENDSGIFSGDDPCQLLGIIKLVEINGEEWQASDIEIRNFLELYYPGSL